MQQIGNEFGFTVDSDTTSLGDYRTLANGSNYPQSIGQLSFSSIDGGGSVATGNNPTVSYTHLTLPTSRAV